MSNCSKHLAASREWKTRIRSVRSEGALDTFRRTLEPGVTEIAPKKHTMLRVSVAWPFSAVAMVPAGEEKG